MLLLLHKVEQKIIANAVGGQQLKVNRAGYLNNYFEVCASEHVHVNALSFADVEGIYDVTYGARVSFIVNLPDWDLIFKRLHRLRRGLYCISYRSIHQSRNIENTGGKRASMHL